MRRAVYFTGAIAVFAAAVFVWSHTALVRTQAGTASMIGGAGKVTASEAAVTISPLDMMMKLDKPLPAESVENPI